MIGRALDAMPEDALQLIISSPLERWTMYEYVTPLGTRCLMGIATDAEWDVRFGDVSEESRDAIEMLEAELRQRTKLSVHVLDNHFDKFGYRFGLPRIVPLIQARARQALARKAVPA